jgi:hypothetical protein
MTAGGLVTASLSVSSARVARRFMAPVRHLAFWVVAWSAFPSRPDRPGGLYPFGWLSR